MIRSRKVKPCKLVLCVNRVFNMIEYSENINLRGFLTGQKVRKPSSSTKIILYNYLSLMRSYSILPNSMKVSARSKRFLIRKGVVSGGREMGFGVVKGGWSGYEGRACVGNEVNLYVFCL